MIKLLALIDCGAVGVIGFLIANIELRGTHSRCGPVLIGGFCSCSDFHVLDVILFKTSLLAI